MNVRERVELLCEKKGIRVSFLEKELGISNGTIGKWTNSKPSAINAKKVADYFNVSVEYILGTDDIGIYDRIKELCKQNNISVLKMETDLDFTSGTVSKWNKHKPSYDRICKVADYFNVSVEYILGEEQKESPSLLEGANENTLDFFKELEKMGLFSEDMSKEEQEYLIDIIKVAMKKPN